MMKPTILSSANVIKLIPPTISKETILQKMVGTRPMREGSINLSVEEYAHASHKKTIVNCYGHGGSGFTTLFGSVDAAIKLFIKTNPSKKSPIRVIGAGCIGLTAAIELKRQGYQVAGVTAETLYEIPSWVAAGYFALVSVKTAPQEQESMNRVGMETFFTYQKIAKGEHAYISQHAVRTLPVYCGHDTESGVEVLEASGLIPPKKDVILDFGNGVIHPHFFEYCTYFTNGITVMRQLHAEIKRLNIPLRIQKIHDFDAVVEPYIFNCSGLGGRELNKDPLMIPVRGHLLALNEKAGLAHMNYMIYTKVKQGEGDEYVYMFPKDSIVTEKHPEGIPCHGILGGTFMPHVDSFSLAQQDEIDRLAFKKMVDRASLFFFGKISK